jgi:hypothetical protein
MVRKGVMLVVVLLMVMAAMPCTAQKRKGKRGNTEQGLINRIISCLDRKDAYCYMDLFPDIDTLTKIAMQYADSNSREYREAQELQENPVKMMHADSVYRANLKASFDSLIAEGEAQDIHWESIVLVRYELVKQRQTRNELYEKMAPTRFVGYIFFVDALTRRVFGMMAGDMLQIKGEWYGGRLREVYEAGTKDEWDDARYYAKKHKKTETDSTKKKEDVFEQPELADRAQKVIVERKFYAGMFDNEIPVQLYVRSLKGSCPQGICAWEAIYKFGDQDDYIRLNITRTEDGKWQMVEDPPSGVMDLTLNKGVFTGTWTSTDNQTGYDVKLTELPASEKKIKRLDAAFLELKGNK